MTYKQESEHWKNIQLDVAEELCLNITESLLLTIRDTYRTIKLQKLE